MNLKNLWITGHLNKHGPLRKYPSIKQKISETYDVAVIGAGWLGLNTALKLHEQGKKIIVLEAGKIASSSVAAHSTAKVSSQHQILFGTLKSKHGLHLTQMYGKMNEEAIADIEKIIDKYKIDCEWKRASHIVFAEKEDEIQTLKDETEVAQQSGLKASFEKVVNDLPIKHLGALVVRDQAYMNPVSYLAGIANVLNEAKVPLYEDSRVSNVQLLSPFEITANDVCIKAHKVVVATHLPILDRTGHFSLVSPSRSYCIAVTLTDNSKMIKETYINVKKSQETRSLRPYGDTLVISGGGHKVGEYPSISNWGFDELEKWARQNFPVKEVVASWSAMDYYPVDQIPYIGLAMHGSPNIYLGTGFSKWGFTQGHAAAQIITDLIQGKENDYAKLFDARRWDVTKSAKDFVKNQMHVSKKFFGDRIKHMCESIDIEDLAKGQGGICDNKVNGKRVAAFKDENGVLHQFSPVCTHLGCHVNWNSEAHLFECPCHGSSFNTLGEVLHGPAKK
ncbi:40s ribosomal protein L44e, partial [Clydaea vesicula]